MVIRVRWVVGGLFRVGYIETGDCGIFHTAFDPQFGFGGGDDIVWIFADEGGPKTDGIFDVLNAVTPGRDSCRRIIRIDVDDAAGCEAQRIVFGLEMAVGEPGEIVDLPLIVMQGFGRFGGFRGRRGRRGSGGVSHMGAGVSGGTRGGVRDGMDGRVCDGMGGRVGGDGVNGWWRDGGG